jgi:hypothetical protein
MVQFIVLGYVPGTNIQIGFDLIARLLAIATVVYLTTLLFKEKKHLKQQLIESINQKAI